MDFVVPAEHRVKLKEAEKDEYIDMNRELKLLWNMKVTAIVFVVSVLGTIYK